MCSSYDRNQIFLHKDRYILRAPVLSGCMPTRRSMDLFLHGTGHCSDNDPVDPSIHSLITNSVKRHMIILLDVFVRCIQPPKLGSSCYCDSEPGISGLYGYSAYPAA